MPQEGNVAKADRDHDHLELFGRGGQREQHGQDIVDAWNGPILAQLLPLSCLSLSQVEDRSRIGRMKRNRLPGSVSMMRRFLGAMATGSRGCPM